MKIQDRQNQPKSLAKLAANGVLYRQAKRMRNLALVLVISAGILGIVNLGAEKRTFEHVVTFIVLFSWFIDEIMLKTLEAKFKKEAAAIQEAFDCCVFDIPWPEYKDISYPTADRINHLEGKATTHTLRKDWYPPGAIPNDPLLAIAHCQRTNCWWDVNLRRKWKSTLLAVFSVFGVAGIIFAILMDTTVARILTLLASTLRLGAWGVVEIRAQNAAIERISRIHLYLSRFSDMKKPSMMQLRGVQDEIFEHRRSNPPIPNWLYLLNRDKQELEAART